MSFKTRIIKLAIKVTPVPIVCCVANTFLKGIARLQNYEVDLDARRAYVRTLLEGEPEPIEVLVENFGIEVEGDSYFFVIRQAQSNKLWLSNAFSKVTGIRWKIPVIPKLKPFMPLALDLLKFEPSTPVANA